MTHLMTTHHRKGASREVLVLNRNPSRRPAGGEPLSRGTRGLSTARAVLKVLAFMAANPQGVSAREVAEELGKSISTAYDLLASLHEEGFAFHESGHGYRLRAEAPVGTSAPEPSPDRALSRAVDELFARTHRRAYLARVGAGSIVITAVRGRQGIPRVPGLGPRIGRSAHALSIGKVVLSLLPEHGRRRYIERGVPAYTPRTITSPAALMSELDGVRADGFAVSRGEFDADFCCVAAPVLDTRGRFLAVLSVSTLSRGFDAEERELVAAVHEVAATAGGRHLQRVPTEHVDAPLLRPRAA